MKTIIALDIGTSSMRTVVFDLQGRALHQTSSEYHTIFPRASYVEEEPDTWHNAAAVTLTGAADYLHSINGEAMAISITSQRASVIPMSREGRPLCNAIMWQDKRTIPICDRLIAEHGLPAFYKKTGLRVNPFFVLNKIIWLRENAPELFNAAVKFIGVQDYVTYELTGKYVTDWTQASRTMLMDLKEFKWDEDLLKLAGISQDQLCDLVPPGSVAGGLSRDFAAQCGLPEGTPVIISGGDQQNAAIALGITHPGVAEANTGTGSFVLSYSDLPVFEKDCRVLCQASAIAGKYMAETSIFNTGAIFRWFKEQFYPELADSPKPFEYMTEQAEQAPVGSHGVTMLPHFEGSAAPYWNPMAKGIFFNLGLGTTRADLTRAIMEGIAMEIAENLSLMRGMIGGIDRVSVAGGMVKSDLFCRIQADAYQAIILRSSNAEATALGAFINAAVTLGIYANHTDALQFVTSSPQVFQPIAELAPVYQNMSVLRNALYSALNEGGVYAKFMI